VTDPVPGLPAGPLSVPAAPPPLPAMLPPLPAAPPVPAAPQVPDAPASPGIVVPPEPAWPRGSSGRPSQAPTEATAIAAVTDNHSFITVLDMPSPEETVPNAARHRS